MIHTAITAIRYQSISIDLLQRSSLTSTSRPLPDSSAQGVLSDTETIVASGTWYEDPKSGYGGLVINETYYQDPIAFPTSESASPDPTLSSAEHTATATPTAPATRRSFKTPPTTVVSTTANRSKTNSYLLFSEKLNDLTSHLPGNSNSSSSSSPAAAPAVTADATTAPTPATAISGGILLRKTAILALEKMNSIDSIDLSGVEDNHREAFSETSVTANVSSKRMISGCGLDRCEISVLLEIYSRPLICNHHLLRDGTQMIIDLFQQWNQAEEEIYAKRIGRSKTSSSASQRNSLDIFCDTAFDCILETSHESLVEQLMLEQSLPELCIRLSEFLERSNQEMCQRWSLVLSSLPKAMKEITHHLRVKYIQGMRAFWKGQSVLFRCRYGIDLFALFNSHSLSLSLSLSHSLKPSQVRL
jgi:hypothetical protein